MDRIDAPENLRITSRGGVLSIWHRRAARDLAEVQVILDALDADIRYTGVHNLLFDSRDAERADAPVQERIWEWLRTHDTVRKVAVVMLAADRERAVRLAGADRGVRIRVFSEAEAARRWLLEG